MLRKYEHIIKSLLNDRECKESGNELHCCCPFHEDKRPSFSINLETGAYNCFACGEKGSITDFVAKLKGVSNSEAWEYIQEQEIIDFKASTDRLDYGLADYAMEKNLNVEKLKLYGLETAEDNKGVVIPYLNENGDVARYKIRCHPKSSIRFYWEKGTEQICLYGLWAINNFKDDYVILVEGESDCHCAWEQDLQVIGVPGANGFKKDYAPLFDRFKKVYVHQENDDGGTTFVNKIASILPVDNLFVISASKIDENCKDLADLHLKNELTLQKLFDTAEPFVPETKEVSNTSKKMDHVQIGQALMNKLVLKFFNGNLYYYANGVYNLAEDKMLENFIVKHICINAKKTLRKETIDFVNSWLADENINLRVNKDYINFRNRFI